MNIEELFLARKSTRNYAPTPVPPELLERVCSLAALAPSACNSQPWKMYAVCGEKAKPFSKNLQLFGMNKWTSECPAFIVIATQKANLTERIGQKMTKSDFIGNDIGILAAHIVLAAQGLGLQSCIIGLRDEKAIANFLCLPDSTSFPLVVAIGYEKQPSTPTPKKRKPLADVFELVQ